MENIENAITQLTGALNLQIEQMRVMSSRIGELEDRVSPPSTNNPVPFAPATEAELNEMRRLPDCVKDLQIFDGNPIQYISWISSVESILKDYEVVKTRPIFRAIMQHIRNKIRGPADTALISYNIFNDDWEKIKTCLSLHYADKRDLRTLEYELTTLSQRNFSVDQFYARINYQLSLIINKIKAQVHSEEAISALIDSYRNRALDVFIRGVQGELSRILIIQKPETLPEAYASCLEIQNMNLRNHSIYPKSSGNANYKKNNYSAIPYSPNELNVRERNKMYNFKNQNNARQTQPQGPPPRPTQPKPPVPMEVDPSLHSQKVNYINRPNNAHATRSQNTSNIPRKQPKLYNIESENEEIDEQENGEEINFMIGADQAFLT